MFGRRPGIVLRVGILARASKIQKSFAAIGRNHRGDPHLLAAASRPTVILFSAWPVRTEGGGVDVASYIPGPARGGLYVGRSPRLQVCTQ